MTDLGDIYRDPISGFVGTATAHATYLHSTPQVRLTAETGPATDGKERWFEEAQVVPHSEKSPGFA